MRWHVRSRGWILMLAALMVACGGSSGMAQSPSGSTSVRTGQWGGEHATLQVEADEPAVLELSCAHARIELPLAVDRQGRFEWQGRYAQERPGPQREGDAEGQPARFVGSLDGDKLTVSITVDGRQVAGPLTLEFGKRTRVVKCA